MANNFLDNYKKKSEQNVGELEKNVEARVAESQPPSSAYRAGDAAQPVATQPVQSAPVASPTTTPATPEQANPPAGLSYEQKSGFVKPTTAATSGGGDNGTPPTLIDVLKRMPVQYYVIAGIVVVLIIVLIVVLSGGTAAPAMVGKRLSDAELWANENQIQLSINDVYSDEVPEGDIISQNPAEGEGIEGGIFEIELSRGPDQSVLVTMPDIMGMTMQEVEDWAAQNHMTKVRITTEDNDDVPEGEVIEFTVNDNTVLSDEVRRDSPIYVVFSRGAGEGEPVKLPNFLTMSLDEAEEFAEENGIKLIIEEVFHDTIAKGMIIKQDIKAEEEVRTGDEVTIEVSRGKEILVPNLFNYTRERGEILLSQEGIKTLVEERYSNLEEDKLISQSLKAGSLYNDEDILELVYSLGNSFVLPSFVGSNETAVREWVTPKNEQGANLTVSTRYTVSDQAAGTVLSQEVSDYTIGITFTINLVVSSGGIVYAPDLVDETGLKPITREAAIAICKELNIVPVFTERSKGSGWPGEVWAQNIAPGTEMSEGQKIELTVNPLDVGMTVPNFEGMDEATAKANYNSLTITFKVGEYVAGKAGLVVSQSLTAGTMVAPGTAIELTVGAPLSIPDFSDKTEASVRLMSQYKDLNVTFEYEDASGATVAPNPSYTVSAQSIAVGTEVATGAAITLTLTPPPTP